MEWDGEKNKSTYKNGKNSGAQQELKKDRIRNTISGFSHYTRVMAYLIFAVPLVYAWWLKDYFRLIRRKIMSLGQNLDSHVDQSNPTAYSPHWCPIFVWPNYKPCSHLMLLFRHHCYWYMLWDHLLVPEHFISFISTLLCKSFSPCHQQGILSLDFCASR